MVNTGDFLCILINFLKYGDAPSACCPSGVPITVVRDGELDVVKVLGGTRDGAPGMSREVKKMINAGMASVEVGVAELAKRVGLRAALASDVDGNGIVDAADIAAFAERSGIGR